MQYTGSRVTLDSAMPVIIALLRAVNVVGRNMIRMEQLRSLCESCGFQSPRTYLQSGNVVFTSREPRLSPISKRLEDAIEHELGFRPAVVTRTPADLKAVVAANPFASRSGINPSKLLVTFLDKDPGQPARDKIMAINVGPEEIAAAGRELYIYYPCGVGTSKLTTALIERTLQGTRGTARNWNTVNALIDLAENI